MLPRKIVDLDKLMEENEVDEQQQSLPSDNTSPHSILQKIM